VIPYVGTGQRFQRSLGGTNPTGSQAAPPRSAQNAPSPSRPRQRPNRQVAKPKSESASTSSSRSTTGRPTWTLSGVGQIGPSEGTLILFIAGDTAGTAAIRAVGPGCCCTITFTVVEPDSLTMEQEAGTHIRHHRTIPTAASSPGPTSTRTTFLSVTSTSRAELRVRRRRGTSSRWTGTSTKGQYQEFSPWFTVGECQPGKGSRCAPSIKSTPVALATRLKSESWSSHRLAVQGR